MRYLVSKLFRAYRLYNVTFDLVEMMLFGVSKLFRAYRLYNGVTINRENDVFMFQSSFELTGYITKYEVINKNNIFKVSKLFRAYRLYNTFQQIVFRLSRSRFKALSSLQVI